MSIKIDLIGKRFGRLIVIREFKKRDKFKRIVYLCDCDCGKSVKVIRPYLRSGDTKSCGCLKTELNIKRKLTHGKRHTPEWQAWIHMRQRCSNPKDNSYHLYGARGIRVCNRWNKSFENFYTDMGKRPSFQHSLDRIDNNGNYKPSNCRWATDFEQSNNTRKCKRVKFYNRLMTLSQLEKISVVNKRVLYNRIFRSKQKWSIEKAVTTPASTILRHPSIAA